MLHKYIWFSRQWYRSNKRSNSQLTHLKLVKKNKIKIMLVSQIKNEQKHNFIDYKQPVNVLESDLRTSTYLGHRYLRQNDFTIPPSTSIISPSYVLHQKEIRYDYASEQTSQYTPKYNFNRTNKANLYMNCSKPTFAKSMEHRIFRNPPKPIRISSSHFRDYTHIPQTHKEYLILHPMSCVGNFSQHSDGGDVGGCYK